MHRTRRNQIRLHQSQPDAMPPPAPASRSCNQTNDIASKHYPHLGLVFRPAAGGASKKAPGGDMVKNDITKGMIAISMAAFLFGAAGALAKILFKADISPIDLTAIRSIVA